MRPLFTARPRPSVLAAALLVSLAAPAARPQNAPAAAASRPVAPAVNGGLVLVLPFENRSSDPALNWIGNSFPDTINQRLSSAGFLTISRDDRLYAYNHLGLPEDFRPTRATTIQIAQTMDADYVVVGSFKVDNGVIVAQAQVLRVDLLRMSQPLEDSSQLQQLFDVENAIAWHIARQIDPRFAVAEQTFLSASGGVSLSSFESYIRGMTAATPEERLQRLKAAAESKPVYPAALLAYGKELYGRRNYDEAAAVLARMPAGNRMALEANFYLGLARFNSGDYAAAENAFAFDAARLALPEVINDEGVAQARQGKDAAPFFQRAVTADPGNPDYHYNLAISLYRRGDLRGASIAVNEALRLRPADTEAAALKTRIASGARYSANSDFSPLERIARTFSEASFRQAAFQLDEARAARISSLPSAEQAQQYTEFGHDYLAQGFLPQAEQQFQAALAADPRNASAHAGLAEVREQSGDADGARKEARTAIGLGGNIDAWLVLARVDLQQNLLAPAADEVHSALALEPKNAAALALRDTLIARGQPVP